MMCTTSIYLVAHRDSKQTEKSSHFEHILNAKIVKANGHKWITYKHTLTHTQHECDTAVRYSHSQCQTEQILIYNYFYCHTEFVQARTAGWLLGWLFLFVRSTDFHHFPFLFLSATFLPIWMFTLSFSQKPTNFDEQKGKKQYQYYVNVYAPLGSFTKKWLRKKSLLPRVLMSNKLSPAEFHICLVPLCARSQFISFSLSLSVLLLLLLLFA